MEPLYVLVLKCFPVNALISFFDLINLYQQQHPKRSVNSMCAELPDLVNLNLLLASFV